MAKLMVVESDGGGRVPFLRGILTRSLQDAGLSFADSYRVASDIRQSLADVEEVTTEELRSRVLAHLGDSDPEVVELYCHRWSQAATIEVVCGEGLARPFSRGQHRLGLESCGLSTEEASSVTQRVHDHLIAQEKSSITLRELGILTHAQLENEIGAEAARNFLLWEQYRHSHRPLLVLVGGTAGSGKSTVATQLAHRLEIVRIQSTDMLREVMRGMVPKELLPVLHTSSFLASQELPDWGGPERDDHAALVDGYLAQTALVTAACKAVIQRTVKERLSLILEGVHLRPSLYQSLEEEGDAIVVPIMLAVLKPSELRRRLRGRAGTTPGRRSRRYLEHFDAIWQIQSFMLSEADQTEASIIQNHDQEATVQRVMKTVFNALARHFTGSVEDVFQAD